MNTNEFTDIFLRDPANQVMLLEINLGRPFLKFCETLGSAPPGEPKDPLRGNILDRKVGDCISTSIPPPGFRLTVMKSPNLTDQFSPVCTVMFPVRIETHWQAVK
jgi:hypothetical protein